MKQKLTITALTITMLILGASAYAGMLLRHANAVRKPAATEFGAGPRTSNDSLYVATLQGVDGLKPRKMYTIQVAITNAATGQPVTDADIQIDGGMPEHGHGFPTRPRVTRNLGNGVYEISGLRFSMGGWWEMKCEVTSPAGTDTVTFNLSL